MPVKVESKNSEVTRRRREMRRTGIAGFHAERLPTTMRVPDLCARRWGRAAAQTSMTLKKLTSNCLRSKSELKNIYAFLALDCR
jgi:hypothetical protein